MSLTHGHRKRLRERFLASTTASVADYELLEILLFSAFPRKDTKAVAKRLLQQFGSLSALCQAPSSALQEIDQVGDSAIAVIRAMELLTQRVGKVELEQRPLLDNSERLLQFCRRLLAHRNHERYVVLFLDAGYHLLEYQMQTDDMADAVFLSPRALIKKALNLEAVYVILVHNHPSGNAEPSKQDIKATKVLQKSLQAVGVRVIEHLIIAKEQHFSFRASEVSDTLFLS